MVNEATDLRWLRLHAAASRADPADVAGQIDVATDGEVEHAGDSDAVPHELSAQRVVGDRTATYDETDVRGRALSAWALGTARLRTNKPDIHTAISDIGEAGKLAAHHRSPRVIQQIQGSWRELSPWHDEPEVQQLRARLSSYGLLA